TISTTSASMLKSDSAVRPTLKFPRNTSISPSRTKFEIACENLRKAHKARVPMLTDTDSGFAVMPYGEWHARKPKFSLSVSASRRPRHCAPRPRRTDARLAAEGPTGEDWL